MADRLDALAGIGATDEVRRRELVTVVDFLAQAEDVVVQVRRSLLGPYGGMLRLAVLNRRSARAIARVTSLNDELNAKLDHVARLPGGDRVAEILQDRLRLHLEAEAELVAGLSPKRRAIVESLRLQSA